jgi:hypothetical protein
VKDDYYSDAPKLLVLLGADQASFAAHERSWNTPKHAHHMKMFIPNKAEYRITRHGGGLVRLIWKLYNVLVIFIKNLSQVLSLFQVLKRRTSSSASKAKRREDDSLVSLELEPIL